MKNFLQDEKGEGEEICVGIIAIIFVLSIIYYIIMFILSIFTQILIVAIIVFAVSRVISKQNKITKWIKPSIPSMTESKISHNVFLNIFAIAPIYNKYIFKNNECIQLETKIQTLSNDIIKKSEIINKTEKQINVLNSSAKSPITINEIDRLTTTKFKEINNKIKMENQAITLKNSLADKQDGLKTFKYAAYDLIDKQQQNSGTKFYEEDGETNIYGEESETKIY